MSEINKEECAESQQMQEVPLAVEQSGEPTGNVEESSVKKTDSLRFYKRSMSVERVQLENQLESNAARVTNKTGSLRRFFKRPEQGDTMNKTNSLRRFFKLSQKKTSDAPDDIASTSSAYMDKDKQDTADGKPGMSGNKDTMQPKRFHLRLGGFQEETPAGTKGTLKSSISKYWHTIFKHSSGSPKTKTDAVAEANVPDDEDDEREEREETVEQLHTLAISEEPADDEEDVSKS